MIFHLLLTFLSKKFSKIKEYKETLFPYKLYIETFVSIYFEISFAFILQLTNMKTILAIEYIN
jgi:hypothetical protein